MAFLAEVGKRLPFAAIFTGETKGKPLFEHLQLDTKIAWREQFEGAKSYWKYALGQLQGLPDYCKPDIFDESVVTTDLTRLLTERLMPILQHVREKQTEVHLLREVARENIVKKISAQGLNDSSWLEDYLKVAEETASAMVDLFPRNGSFPDPFTIRMTLPVYLNRLRLAREGE